MSYYVEYTVETQVEIACDLCSYTILEDVLEGEIDEADLYHELRNDLETYRDCTLDVVVEGDHYDVLCEDCAVDIIWECIGCGEYIEPVWGENGWWCEGPYAHEECFNGAHENMFETDPDYFYDEDDGSVMCRWCEYTFDDFDTRPLRIRQAEREAAHKPPLCRIGA